MLGQFLLDAIDILDKYIWSVPLVLLPLVFFPTMSYILLALNHKEYERQDVLTENYLDTDLVDVRDMYGQFSQEMQLEYIDHYGMPELMQAFPYDTWCEKT